MSSIRLKPISKTISEITVGRDKIGRIVEKQDGSGFYGVATYNKVKIEATENTRTAVWEKIVRGINRVGLCGINDAAKAHEALIKNNERVRQEAENWNKLWAGSEFSRFMQMRVRNSKVSI